MSHFLSPGAVALLAPGVITGAVFLPLVARRRPAQGVTPGEPGAAVEAVDIAPVAVAADDDQLAAAGARVEAMGGRRRGLVAHTRLDRRGDSPEDGP